MGLDIYLYTTEDAEWNRAYEQASDQLYETGPDGKSKRDNMSDEELAAWRELYTYRPHVDVPSERYPDHLFNRRHLRSSYNEGGFNHAVPALLGTKGDADYPDERGSLYWIFEPMGREWDGDDGHLTSDDLPKLAECRKRAETIVREIQSSDRLRVMTVAPNMFSAPPSHTDSDALRMYRDAIKARTPTIDADTWYSSRDMEVFGSGATVLAAIPGRATFDIPGVHLIYKGSDKAFESYAQSAVIVAEFIDETVSLIDRDGSARISWSG